MKTSLSYLVLLCLVASALTACADSPTPLPVAGKPAVPALAASPTTEGRTATPLPIVGEAPVTTSPTIPKPTATFVPLITPSATPTGDQPTRASVPRIGVAEARALAEAGHAILVDVRTPGTYEEAHIAGALSLPLDEVAGSVHDLAGRARELGDEALIIFYCA